MAKYKELKIVILIVLGGILGVVLLAVLFPSTPPKGERNRPAALVETTTLKQQTVNAPIEGYGTVEAKRLLSVQPQVSGEVVEINPNFQKGGRIAKGELLFQIDPRDYEIAAANAEAALERARFQYKLEQGNQIVAKREFELLEPDAPVAELNRELALREPHLKEKRAALKAAQSQLEKAKLDLKRSTLTAPFDAVVLSEQVEESRFVNQQTQTGEIASTEAFFVEIRVPSQALEWLQFLNDGEIEQRPAAVYQRLSTERSIRHEGRLVRLLSDVDPSGRMAKLLVSVEDPLEQADGTPPLLIGSYVRVEIKGRAEKGVFLIPRSALREGETVWLVADDQTLRKEPVEVIFTDGDSVAIRIEQGEGLSLITNTLPGALEGMPVAVADGGEGS